MYSNRKGCLWCGIAKPRDDAKPGDHILVKSWDVQNQMEHGMETNAGWQPIIQCPVCGRKLPPARYGKIKTPTEQS